MRAYGTADSLAWHDRFELLSLELLKGHEHVRSPTVENHFDVVGSQHLLMVFQGFSGALAHHLPDYLITALPPEQPAIAIAPAQSTLNNNSCFIP